MTTDVYFKFPDAATANSILPDGTFQNMDVVGQITAADGSTPWLVNVRPVGSETVTPAMAAYVIDPPLFPQRIWEPDQTGAAL